MRRQPAEQSGQTVQPPNAAERRLIERGFAFYELYLLRAIVALAEFDGRDFNTRLNYISALSSLDGSWRQVHDEVHPMIALLRDECPVAARYLKRALKHLKTATRALRRAGLD